MGRFHRREIQTMPRERLRALQEERLAEVVRRAHEIPFFQRKLEGAGIGPGDVKTLEDLGRVPRTVKQELRDSEAAAPPLGDYRGAPRDRCVRLATSTGTTGRPTITLFTPHDLEVEYDAACRMFARLGYRPGEVITHAHPGGLNGGASILGGAIERFGALNVAVGPPLTARDAQAAIAVWRELRPDHYEVFGPALHTFWEAAREAGLDPAGDLNMPPPRDLAPYRTVSAGMECFAFLGSACEEGRGAHVCEDEAIVEVVDPLTGAPRADGERGHLVVTTLTKDNPMLRYDLEDLVRVDRSACGCGETHLRAFWEGRAADVVVAGKKEILPLDVQHVLAGIPEIGAEALEFQIVRSADTSALAVRVEAAGDVAALARRLSAALEETLGAPARVEVVPEGALPRPYYKPLRVVDE